MGPQDITYTALALLLLLFLAPVLFSIYFKMGLVRAMLLSAGRMAAQLSLMAVYLSFLFRLENPVVNLAWIVVVVVIAAYSVVSGSDLKRKLFIAPVFLSLLISSLGMLFYFNKIVLGLENVYETKYFIVIGGMFLGNSLKGNIIGLSGFYKDMQRNRDRYVYRLAAGASAFESVIPYIRNAVSAALRPSIAAMATMGIVHLPGMMTGQILGGSSPETAIKYQIAIMIAIFTLTAVTIILSILFTLRLSLNEYGMLKHDVIRNKK